MPPPTYLVTGASRGIGLEFVKQLAARGVQIIAAVRDQAKAEKVLEGAADSIAFVSLDAADPRSIETLGERVGQRPIDVLINNAGVHSEQKRLADVTARELARVFQINTYAPILIAKALMPNLRAGSRRLIVQVSTQLASIAENTGGSSYAYRASKTALNQLNKSLANELAPDGFTCVAIHPGWVKTDMGGPNAPLGVRESVVGMLKVMDGLTQADTGRFLRHDGAELPW